MSIFDKLKFWKKEEPSFAPPQLGEFGGESFGAAPFEIPGLGPKEGITRPPSLEPMGGFGSSQPFGAPTLQPAFSQQPVAPQSTAELQLVSAKLDTLRVMLENISARLARLEQMAQEASQPETTAPKRSQPQVRWEY